MSIYSLLTGLTVIEASSFVASPSAGLYLAQMGARVIRVDQAGGGLDFKRWPKTREGASLYWENLNRAKESVALNLAVPEGRALLQSLIRKTGQCLTNFPRKGFLSHKKLSEGCDELITVRIMGNADGSAALDYTVNALVGYPDMTGLGSEPVNHILPAWDLLTGAYAAFAMLAALRHREATGGEATGGIGAGQEVCIPLSDVAIGTVANLGSLAEMLYTGANRERLGNSVYGAFGRDFVTADGVRVMIMAITARQWAGLVQVLAIEEDIKAIEATRCVSFAQDEGERFKHRDILYPLVEATLAAWKYADFAAAMERVGGCYGRYQTMHEAAHDPALVADNPLFGSATPGAEANPPSPVGATTARAAATTAANPSGFSYPAAGAMATIPHMERGVAQPAPLLGAHTDQILSEILELSPRELAALHDRRVIAQA